MRAGPKKPMAEDDNLIDPRGRIANENFFYFVDTALMGDTFNHTRISQGTQAERFNTSASHRLP